MIWIDKNMAKTDIRTAAQKSRDALHAKVCNLYKKLKEEHPTSSDNRLTEVIGEQIGITRQGATKILMKHGLYERKKKEEHGKTCQH